MTSIPVRAPVLYGNSYNTSEPHARMESEKSREEKIINQHQPEQRNKVSKQKIRVEMGNKDKIFAPSNQGRYC